MTAQAPWIARQTRQLLAQRGHAWLLHGPSGLGQYGLALELARAWLCDQPGAAGACANVGAAASITLSTAAGAAPVITLRPFKSDGKLMILLQIQHASKIDSCRADHSQGALPSCTD